MILGLDPIYWICLGFVGMLVFVTVMFVKMRETVTVLKEIRDAQKITNAQHTGPLVTITTDPLLAAFGQSRQQPMPVERTGSPDTQPVNTLGVTSAMPRSE